MTGLRSYFGSGFPAVHLATNSEPFLVSFSSLSAGATNPFRCASGSTSCTSFPDSAHCASCFASEALRCTISLSDSDFDEFGSELQFCIVEREDAVDDVLQ